MCEQILVIDDDLAVRKSFMLALEDANYNVDVAESGEAGLEKMSTMDYNLIFLDLKMPGITGVETLMILRNRGYKMVQTGNIGYRSC
ncbi:MAG: response regulator [Planctomycetes bacterium]|nr:response regulator [Planctomycetota bacterium]